ncbi:hypothetical protein CLOM_g1741 [Closterium sp. NIES-68]|nr:hypothetical protein CLOM_g1741 [Closterium sp. NIES-68]
MQSIGFAQGRRNLLRSASLDPPRIDSNQLSNGYNQPFNPNLSQPQFNPNIHPSANTHILVNGGYPGPNNGFHQPDYNLPSRPGSSAGPMSRPSSGMSHSSSHCSSHGSPHGLSQGPPCDSPQWTRGPQLGGDPRSKAYLALHAESGQIFVAKSVSSRALPRDMRQLDSEQAILEDLRNSPRVVRLLGADWEDDPAAPGARVRNLFMEYVSGGSVADIMSAFGGSLPEALVRRYARGICEGLREPARAGDRPLRHPRRERADNGEQRRREALQLRLRNPRRRRRGIRRWRRRGRAESAEAGAVSGGGRVQLDGAGGSPPGGARLRGGRLVVRVHGPRDDHWPAALDRAARSRGLRGWERGRRRLLPRRRWRRAGVRSRRGAAHDRGNVRGAAYPAGGVARVPELLKTVPRTRPGQPP